MFTLSLHSDNELLLRTFVLKIDVRCSDVYVVHYGGTGMTTCLLPNILCYYNTLMFC